VNGVNLGVASGEILGIVGESGCGKSTLAKDDARAARADGGEILLEGSRSRR
jgi:ABC-type oligopeptide transport system ATPase subunit